MKSAYLTASILAFAAAMPAAARDQIQVTGSSTVLPYATIVAEAFGENFDFPTPVVEGGGSGAGLTESAHSRRERPRAWPRRPRPGSRCTPARSPGDRRRLTGGGSATWAFGGQSTRRTGGIG